MTLSDTQSQDITVASGGSINRECQFGSCQHIKAATQIIDIEMAFSGKMGHKHQLTPGLQ